MKIKLIEIAGFEEKIQYSFNEKEEVIEISWRGVSEVVNLSTILQKMVEITYDEPLFNEYRPIVSAERDGGGELLVEILWPYSGNIDQIKLEKEWNGAEELWQKLYQNLPKS